MQALRSSVHLGERLDYGNLVNPSLDKNRPIYNWYSYKHSYSRELVAKLLGVFEISENSLVLDPFCGCGTTILTCKDLGISAKGFDVLPFSVFVTNTKIGSLSLNPYFLEEQLHDFRISKSSVDTEEISKISIIKKGFRPEVLKTILRVRDSIFRISPHANRDFFMLGLLGILEQFSQTQKSGGFLRLVSKETQPSEVLPTFRRKIETMIHDLISRCNRTKSRECHATCDAELGDSRKLPTRKKFDAAITSPPYPNRHDYTRIYTLELAIGFSLNNAQLKEIRYKTLRSHVEARPQHNVKGYYEPEILVKLIKEMKKKELNNEQIIPMLRGYFEDMFLTLSEINRCLKDTAKAALVVSNVRYAGLTIPVDLVLSEIGKQVDLMAEEIWTVRLRGNSSQQMAQYSRIPSRESIVIFRKN